MVLGIPTYSTYNSLYQWSGHTPQEKIARFTMAFLQQYITLQLHILLYTCKILKRQIFIWYLQLLNVHCEFSHCVCHTVVNQIPFCQSHSHTDIYACSKLLKWRCHVWNYLSSLYSTRAKKRVIYTSKISLTRYIYLVFTSYGAFSIRQAIR